MRAREKAAFVSPGSCYRSCTQSKACGSFCRRSGSPRRHTRSWCTLGTWVLLDTSCEWKQKPEAPSMREFQPPNCAMFEGGSFEVPCLLQAQRLPYTLSLCAVAPCCTSHCDHVPLMCLQNWPVFARVRPLPPRRRGQGAGVCSYWNVHISSSSRRSAWWMRGPTISIWT
jgi:hypothetical protein